MTMCCTLPPRLSPSASRRRHLLRRRLDISSTAAEPHIVQERLAILHAVLMCQHCRLGEAAPLAMRLLTKELWLLIFEMIEWRAFVPRRCGSMPISRSDSCHRLSLRQPLEVAVPSYAYRVQDLMWTHDSKLMLACFDRLLIIDPLTSSTKCRQWRARSGFNLTCACSPSGRMSGIGGCSNVLEVWRTEEASVYGRAADLVLVGHEAYISHARWWRTDEHVLTTSADATCRLWDVERAASTWVGMHGGEVVGHAPLGEHELVTVCCESRDSVSVWDVRQAERTASLSGHVGDVKAVTALPGRTLCLTGGDDGTLRAWDLRTHRELHVLRARDSMGDALAMTQEGHLLSWDLAAPIIAETQEALGVASSRHTPFWRKMIATSPNGAAVATNALTDIRRVYANSMHVFWR
jgi:hypothetical protein